VLDFSNYTSILRNSHSSEVARSTMASSLESWAVPRLQQLLPLDEDSLKQIITYTDTLPKDVAAEHLKNMLGDSPQAFEFISTFNMRRQRPPNEAATKPSPAQQQASSSNDAAPRTGSPASANEVPKAKGRQQKKKANIHALPARQVEDHGNVSGGYRKRQEEDYTSRPARPSHKQQVADNLALREKPDAKQMPLITDTPAPTTKPLASRPPPSAAGQLISDNLAPPSKKGSAASSRHVSPAPKTKINLTGGTAMHGASTALSDLDAAIRALEIQTNPSLASDSPTDTKKRNCNCMATRHPLLDMAPNCLSCGKVICLKQGLGPCTFCGSPIISNEEISKVLRILKDERGEEKMKANNASHKKADVASGKARAFTGREFLSQASSSAKPSPLSSAAASEDEDAKDKAKAHRDRLLTFQANNARRTQIHDEAADYDVPSTGTSMWASPQERAQQLKKQQRMLREMNWNARPEYEKRQMVASIDLKGGKIVRRMAEVEKPDFSADDEDELADGGFQAPAPEGGKAGAFSNNPLVGAMVRPKAKEDHKGKNAEREKRSTWRRVQMDEDDNEGWILDGGTYGGRIEGRVLGEEEHAVGS
jgi:hypothetical protein